MATKWTKEKEDIILEEVNKNPEHIRDALFIASLKINKTHSATVTHFYNNMNIENQSKEEQIKRISDELIKMYELNLELKKQLDNGKT